jgi:hypothetical protein
MTMETFYVHNPLLTTAVRKKLDQVIEEFGYRPFDATALPDELYASLCHYLDFLPNRTAEGLRRMAAAVRKGKVLATESLPDGCNTFLVRTVVKHHDVDLLLSYTSEGWRVQRVTSILPRPIWLSRWLKYPVQAALLIGIALAGGWSYPWISSHTGWLAAMAKQGLLPSRHAADSRPGGPSGVASAFVPSRDVSGATDTAEPKMYTFEMAPGMTPQDLVNFLVQNGLVKDGAAFTRLLVDHHLDTSIRVGMYTFTSRMNEYDLLQAIANGPAHPTP